jgi:hypothetical protein
MNAIYKPGKPRFLLFLKLMRSDIAQGSAPEYEGAYFGPSALARRLWVKLLIVFLLVGVAVLSTLAKDSLYLFHSHSAMYVSSSVKMQLANIPDVDMEPVRPVLRTLPPKPESRRAQAEYDDFALPPAIGFTVSLQHRSPPLPNS